jgi:hypothetical protein
MRLVKEALHEESAQWTMKRCHMDVTVGRSGMVGRRLSGSGRSSLGIQAAQLNWRENRFASVFDRIVRSIRRYSRAVRLLHPVGVHFKGGWRFQPLHKGEKT